MSFWKMNTMQNLPWFRANTFFHKESILHINIRFRKHVEENHFDLVHAK